MDSCVISGWFIHITKLPVQWLYKTSYECPYNNLQEVRVNMLALTVKKNESGSEWICIDINGQSVRVTAKKENGKVSIIFDAPKEVLIYHESKKDNLQE